MIVCALLKLEFIVTEDIEIGLKQEMRNLGLKNDFDNYMSNVEGSLTELLFRFEELT